MNLDVIEAMWWMFCLGLWIGVFVGNWLDTKDILYICPRCKERGGNKKIRNAITDNAEHCSRLSERLKAARDEGAPECP